MESSVSPRRAAAALGVLGALTMLPPTAAAAVDVGVSITISEPGVYGRIDIGRFPQPRVVVATPVIVAPPRVRPPHPVAPVYLWVPPGHRKNWDRHCASYGACGVPVLFVRQDWYREQVMPHAAPERRMPAEAGRQGRGPGPGKGPGNGSGPGPGRGGPGRD